MLPPMGLPVLYTGLWGCPYIFYTLGFQDHSKVWLTWLRSVKSLAVKTIKTMVVGSLGYTQTQVGQVSKSVW